MKTRKKLDLRTLCLVSLMTALTAIGAFIRIPLPGLMPFTLQTFFCALAGLMLGPGPGALSQALYLLLGLLGLPIFTQGGGFLYVLQPSFGFLLGLIPAAVVAGLGRGPVTGLRLLTRLVLSWAVLYAVGLPYLYFIQTVYLHTNITFAGLMQGGLISFLPGDAVKLGAALFVGMRLERMKVRRGAGRL